MGDLVGEYLLNPLKYLAPAVLIFDGARNRPRVLLALAATLVVYVLLSILVVRWVPLADAMTGGELGNRALRRLDNEVGLHARRSVMLAGAWAPWRFVPCHPALLGLLAAAGFAALPWGSMGPRRLPRGCAQDSR
jgi:hypothetical protein